MPGTPPLLEPLHQEVAPDTQRDAQLALRAERRRWGTILLIAAVIGSFAVGGFLIGRRQSRAALDNVTPATASTATTPPVVTNALTESALAASGAPSPSASASSAPSVSLTSSAPGADPAIPTSAAAPARPVHRRQPKPATTPEGEPKPAEPTPTPNPYSDP